MAESVISEARLWLHHELNGAVTLTVLCSSFVVLRIVSTRGSKKEQPWSWDDSFILAALPAFITLCACAIVQSRAYLTYYSIHDSEDRIRLYATIYKASYVSSVTYPVACALPKLSICCMYLRFFRVNAAARKTTLALIALTTINAVAWLVPSIAVCHPISAYWSTLPHLTNCIDYNVFGAWISLPHIITDLMIMILPLPMLWGLQMSPTKKIGLTATFITGSIGVVGACLRLAFYIRRTYADRLRTNESPKQSAANVIVSYTEPGMYVIAACLPRLRFLLSRLHASLTNSSYFKLLRSHERKDMSPARLSAQNDHISRKRHAAPKIDLELTNQGRLDLQQEWMR